MKVDELYELAGAADMKYYGTAEPLSDEEYQARSVFTRHIREHFMDVLCELRRLNAEVARYAEEDGVDLPQCTDSGTMQAFEEVDV